MYNYMWNMKQNLQLPVSIYYELACYYTNKGEVETINCTMYLVLQHMLLSLSNMCE